MKKLFLFSAFIYNLSLAQNFTITQQKTIGSSNEDSFINIVQTNDNGYIISGYSSGNISGEKTENSKGYMDYWILKLSSTFQIEWQKTIGGNDFDVAPNILNINSGGYLVTGRSASPISGDKTIDTIGNWDIWVLKLDNNGNILWQNVYGGALGEAIWGNNPATELSDGSFVIACQSSSNASGNKTENCRGLVDYWIFKIDGNGNMLWDRTLGGNGWDAAYSITKDNNDFIYVCGQSDTDIDGDKTVANFGYQNIWLLKLNPANGAIIWQNVYGGSLSESGPNLSFKDGYIYLSSASESGISGNKTESCRGASDGWMLKIDPNNGNIIWDKTIGGSGADGFGRTILNDNKIYVLGNTYSPISGEIIEAPRGSGDMWIICMDTSNNLIWQKRIGGSLLDVAMDLYVVNNNRVIIGGYSRSNISFEKSENCRGQDDYWIVELDINLATNENYSIEPLTIFPNPVSDKLYIQQDLVFGNPYYFYDAQGKLVQHTFLKDNYIDVSHLERGVYFIMIYSNNLVYSGKILKY